MVLSPDRPKGPQLGRILEDLAAELGPHARLPSERELAARYGVARMTVRAELDRLVRAGAIERAHGRGTFVAEARIPKTDRLLSFSAEMRQRGLIPGSKILSVGVDPASPALARELEIDPGESVVTIERLRVADGRPMAIERACLPEARYPGLAEVDLTDESLYEVLAERWAAVPVTAEQRVGAVLLTDEEAERLAVAPPAPALLFLRTTRLASGEVMEHTRSRYRADRYEVTIQVTTPEVTRPQVTSAEVTASEVTSSAGRARTTRASRRREAGANPSP